MARMIDADALKQQVAAETIRQGLNTGKAALMLALIDAAPTIDPERHASWEYRAYHDDEGERRFVASCTKCGQIRVAGIGLANYCPNCGARMDGEGEKDG